MAPLPGKVLLHYEYISRRDQEGRLVRIETPRATELEIILEVMENQPENQHSQHGQGNDPNLYRSMRDRMHPPRMSAPSCIIPPTEQLIIRPHIVPLLPTFHMMESENPYAHIKEFKDVCNTFQEGGTTIEIMRLKLFPFTLKDKAKIWLNSLRPRSIRTWTELQADFLKKFFPTHRTNGLKRQISNFSALIGPSGFVWTALVVPSRAPDDSQGVFLPQSGDGFLSVHDYLGRPESHNHSFQHRRAPGIFEGFYFGPYHLIMAVLLYFEEKVHRKKLQRADMIPLLFLRLLYHILEHMGYPTEPHLECRHHCREHFTLDQWT
uniref:Retrotransposon gag domain-containing protein n=1 Tax=Vitis vinifera TaxID=29760 RepID=A5BDI7_VITVI|nr:hypothetical protein VITISV_043241 [Vitis vinifera]